MKRLAVLWLSTCSSLFAQGTLSLEQIGADPRLWPAEVMVVVDHKEPVVSDGKTPKTRKVGPGHMYPVQSINAEGVTVRSSGTTISFKADDTDLMARAEQIKAQREAPAATPEPTPTPVPTPPPGSAPQESPLQKGLPYTWELPPGFSGPRVRQSSQATARLSNFVYTRSNGSGHGNGFLEIGIIDLGREDAGQTADTFLQNVLASTAKRYSGFQLGPIQDGRIGDLPARQASWTALGHTGPVSGQVLVHLRYPMVYFVDIEDTYSFSSKSFPEMLSAIQTLKFLSEP